MEILKLIEDYPHLDLDSNIRDVGDSIDQVNFIIEMEKIYEFEVLDLEAELFSRINMSLRQIHHYLIFLKTGEADPSIIGTIKSEIKDLGEKREVYTDFLNKIRLDKIDSILDPKK
jgi:hypothetical protein